MKLQRQHFLLSYLKTLSVGPVGVSNSQPPASQPGEQPSELPVGGYSGLEVLVRYDEVSLNRSSFPCILPYMVQYHTPSIFLFSLLKSVRDILNLLVKELVIKMTDIL